MFGSFSGQWLTLTTVERLATGTVISVEYNDVLFIGETVSCTPKTGDRWAVIVKVAQTLTGLQSLMLLRAQLERDPRTYQIQYPGAKLAVLSLRSLPHFKKRNEGLKYCASVLIEPLELTLTTRPRNDYF